jgi:thioredoxin 2
MSESVHVVCPHCHTTNRVAQADLAKAPDCGHCHRALFTGKPVALGETAFERHVARSQIPLLVDFWAPWCGPCRMMAPAFEQAAAQLEPRVRLVKVNTDEAQTVGARLAIRSIPTLALFVNGKEVARQAGAMGAGDIVRWAQAKLQAARPVQGGQSDHAR